MIVAAATDPSRNCGTPPAPVAGRVSTLRRIVPARAFDRQIRKLNRLACLNYTTRPGDAG